MFSKKILFGIAIIICFSHSSAFAQQTYSVTLQNGIQLDSYTYEFDIYISTNDGEFELTSYQSSLIFNNSQVKNGEISFLYIQGTSQLSNIPSLGMGVKKNDNYDVLTFASLPGSDIINRDAKRIGTFSITSGIPFTGSNLNILWNFDGRLTTIVTGTNFIDITDSTCFYSYIGPMSDDLVSNGTFDTDTNWSKGTGCSIGSGVASIDGTQTGNTWFDQDCLPSPSYNKTYLVTFDLVVSAGSAFFDVGGYDYPMWGETSSGYHSYYFTPTNSSSNTAIHFGGNADFVGTFDNVVVKEVFNDRDNITDNKDVEQTYKYSLQQNYPNPFNPATKIKFSIPQGAFVQIKIYNAIGQEITTLVNKYCFSGSYEVNFGNKNLPSGLYIYSLFTDNKLIQSRKMILLK